MPDSIIDQTACDVVVVNYNAGSFLTRCVRSILASDIPLRLIIVDNASRDTSLQSIENLALGQHDLIICKNTKNYGFSKAVNIGAKQCKTPYLMLLNPDCEIHPHTIRGLIEQTKALNDWGVLGALVFNEDGTEQRGCRRLEPTFKRSVVTALRLGKRFQSVNCHQTPLPFETICIDAVSGSAMLIERATFDRIGGMDEGYFLHVEDLDYCRRVREAGKKIYFTPHVSLFHHHGASSHDVPVQTEWYKHQGMLRYQSKFQRPHQNALRSWLTRGVIYMHLVLAMVRKKLNQSKIEQQEIKSLLLGNRKPLLILGARSELGESVLRTISVNKTVIAVTRSHKPPSSKRNQIWLHEQYFNKVPLDDFNGVDTILALSPIWTTASYVKKMQRFSPIKRIIAFSSTSIMAKQDSQNTDEQKVVSQLKKGEHDVLSFSEQGANVTVCRSSMIYGGKENQNIGFIDRIIKRFSFIMIPSGNGLRQPSHVEDLTKAIGNLLDKQDLPQNIYILAGGEKIQYHAMVERIFKVNHKSPRIFILPKQWVLGLVTLISWLPKYRFLNREMVHRLDQDMAYDITPAQQDFNYSPGKFRP